MGRRELLVIVALLVLAGAFRIAVAHWLRNDAPEDGKVYAQIARNVLEQHVYSHETQAPYDPSLIRAPGYPLFLAVIYKVFGHTNNGAVRIIQAVIDTASCALVALLGFYWQPDEKRKRATAIGALALAAVNPFTTIYAATILTEVPAMFLALATCVAATIGFRAGEEEVTTETRRSRRQGFNRSILWWGLAGLFAGLGMMFRPDSGLFAAAICLTVLIVGLRRFWSAPPKRSTKFLSRTFAATLIFSFACLLVLTPWTIRNWRVFHLFQPLQPMHAEMPDEFVPRGYIRWLKTWIDDQRYIDPFWWELDIEPIDIDELPDNAFDSDAERARVAALLDQYNHPANAGDLQATPSPTPTPQPSPTSVNPKNQQKNSNANNSEKETDNENSNDQEDEDENAPDESDQAPPQEHGPVEMTPEIDAGFAQIASERIARHPFRYYVWVPAKRAHALWFNTHSDFYPFEGALLPLDELDRDAHQQIWLPLFALLVGIYTVLGVAGLVVLWMSGDFYARSWVVLAGLIICGRLAFFSSVESPEPRYVVELFPFLAVLGGIAITRLSIFIRLLRGGEEA